MRLLTRSPRRRIALTAGVVGATALLAAGCGVTSASSVPAAPANSCGVLVSNVLGGIVKRIYSQAASGRNVASSVKRLARSRQLPLAVAAGDPAATKAALKPLLKNQIRRIIVTRGTRVLAHLGRGSALAPTRGSIRNHGVVVGHYVIAVSSEHALSHVAAELTGSRIIVRRAGGPPVRRAGATTVSFAATKFPTGRMRIYVTVPAPAPSLCAATPAQTVADTVGLVGQRLFRAEQSGPDVLRVIRHVARDARFRRAVIGDNPAALRTAIVRFFRTRSLHVVRIRATTADGSLVNDVGGPFVLAPAFRALRDSTGSVVGSVTLSVQDDTGYIKLMHRFTGADVLLRTATGQVPGSSLSPGPDSLPTAGAISYLGRTFQVSGFQAQAFPDGPLAISLLVPLTTR